ncbi:hypothetical protein BS78_10G074000 [Paspalum vaginatum]|nr:hypothetical protein BS78_10G074000 [Paspalum vaginatum]
MSASSSRAPAGATAMQRASESTEHLWAKAAELERDFAGYKRRLAERMAHGVGDEVPERGGDGDAAAERGRRYEEYVRRRDERLRQEWRARMERKEAEMQELWARLDGSRGRRGGGELAAASFAREDQVKVQKPGNLVVKAKPAAPVTPRCNNPAAKLARPRTGVRVPSSPATASPRLSTPDPRRRPSHLHREQPQPPATPRKENRLPPPPPATSPATPRPRTMMSRSRSLFGDRGCSSVTTVRDSPRPPRFQVPRSSYDGLSNLKEPAPSPRVAVTAVTQSNSCPSEQSVLAGLKKASAVAPEPPFYARRSGNGVEPAPPPPLVMVAAPRDEPDGSDQAAGGGNADSKSNREYHQSSDKVGSVDITGDSDTEPSYVYIKKDTSGEQTPRPPQASAGLTLGTCPGAEPRSDNDGGGGNGEDTVESTGSNDVVVAGETPTGDSEEESRKESSESLYSNVQSSFSPRSELDASATGSPLPSATEQSPEPEASPPRPRKNTEVEGAEKSLPIPRSSGSTAASITMQSPRDAVNGLKRLLTFGKRIGKNSEAAPAVERASHSVAPAAPAAGDDGSSVTGGCPAGGSVKLRLDSSDDLDKGYVISPRVRSLQSFVPSAPANSELKEPVLHAKSPRVHRSFFSLSSFKSRAN